MKIPLKYHPSSPVQNINSKHLFLISGLSSLVGVFYTGLGLILLSLGLATFEIWDTTSVRSVSFELLIGTFIFAFILILGGIILPISAFLRKDWINIRISAIILALPIAYLSFLLLFFLIMGL